MRIKKSCLLKKLCMVAGVLVFLAGIGAVIYALLNRHGGGCHCDDYYDDDDEMDMDMDDEDMSPDANAGEDNGECGFASDKDFEKE